MESRAMLRHSGIPPRKMRLIADMVRGKDVDVALHTLQFVNRAASDPMRKLIQSAAANALSFATAGNAPDDTIIENCLFHDIDWQGLGYGFGVDLLAAPQATVRRLTRAGSRASSAKASRESADTWPRRP